MFRAEIMTATPLPDFTNFLLIHNTLYLYQVLPLAFLISESARVGINHTGWRPVMAVFYYTFISGNRNIVSSDSTSLIK